ncbi:DoxX family protein [Chryseolinea sp. H1M3-3]|uniref:DoxX family protein n=1 Tax=Chryseolinea sp. H1M3-3 TaxID=3034144 RepID=UPI0023EC984E|nr:DoxX family protein [Chryseolinea sp. H1M3-3]
MDNQDLAKLLLRITCGGILLFHGFHKVFVEIDHVKVIVANAGMPEFLAYGNIVGEFVAPIFVLLGFKTRIAALIIAFNMLLSILIAHPDIVFSVNDYGGWMIETNMLYLMTAVVLVFSGAGRYSVSRGEGKWD